MADLGPEPGRAPGRPGLGRRRRRSRAGPGWAVDQATRGWRSRLSAITSKAAISAAIVAVSQVDGPPMTQNRIHGMKPTTGWLASRRAGGSPAGL